MSESDRPDMRKKGEGGGVEPHLQLPDQSHTGSSGLAYQATYQKKWASPKTSPQGGREMKDQSKTNTGGQVCRLIKSPLQNACCIGADVV